jgi:hypothetical protein
MSEAIGAVLAWIIMLAVLAGMALGYLYFTAWWETNCHQLTGLQTCER